MMMISYSEWRLSWAIIWKQNTHFYPSVNLVESINYNQISKTKKSVLKDQMKVD